MGPTLKLHAFCLALSVISDLRVEPVCFPEPNREFSHLNLSGAFEAPMSPLPLRNPLREGSIIEVTPWLLVYLVPLWEPPLPLVTGHFSDKPLWALPRTRSARFPMPRST